MIRFDEAIDIVRAVARPLGTETVGIAKAANRVLARPVIARTDSPRSDVSAMDGYAVRDEDLTFVPTSLEVVGESFAGAGWNGSVTCRTAVRIFTGAPVPSGADRVVIQENVRREDSRVIIETNPGTPRYIRKRGSDFNEGDALLLAGRRLDPRAIVAAAAADAFELEVSRRPRLSILSTGDELAAPGAARDRPDAIPESVSFGVAALARQWGAECIATRRLRDDLPTMETAAESVLGQSDLVVVTGGASVGDKDFARTMFEPMGLELLFSRVSIKPGKPVWFGRVGEKLVLGLPGNPTSAMVTARLFLAPLLAGLTGRQTEEALAWQTMPITSPLQDCGARETFHRARLVDGSAEILSFQDSSAQKVLAEADLLVRQPPDRPALEAGTTIEALNF